MTPIEQITELAQQIYLGRNQDINDVKGTELDSFINNTISWVNQFIPELEKEAYWNWSRENDYSFGTAGSATKIGLDKNIRAVVIDLDRPITLVKGGRVVSIFDMVNPSMLRNAKDPHSEDRATVVGRELILSRPPQGDEIGATITGDIVYYLPKLTRTNAKLLTTVDPVQLIVLGVLKNQTLPDIVQGGLSPSYAQKYADLLEGAKALNDLSSSSGVADTEDLSGVRGVW